MRDHLAVSDERGGTRVPPGTVRGRGRTPRVAALAAVVLGTLAAGPAGGSHATVSVPVGDLPPGKVLVVKFRSAIDAQSNKLLPAVANQASVAATELGSPVLSDDPAAGGTADPTVTVLDELVLGNRVFSDANGNSTFDPGEGVVGVALTLFADDGGTPGSLDGTDTQLATTTTGADGLYTFAGLAPGEYLVRVDAGNFGAGQPLENHTSLPGAPDPDDNVDHDDNGVDSATPATTGIASLAITLAYNTETTPGTGNDTNPTLDFGFVLGPDIEVTKTESADPVIAGDATPGNLVYTITAKNLGAVAATGVEVTETLTLPAGVTVDSVVASMGTSVTGTNPYTWTVGGLAPAGMATLTVTLTVAADAADGATVSDTAELTAINEIDGNPTNDSVTENTTVVRRADLEVVKTDSPDPVIAGGGVPGNLTYQVTVTNNGPSDATGVALSEVLGLLPAGVTLVSVTPSGATTYAPPNAAVGTWTVGDLDAGSSETLTLVLTVAASAAAGVDVVENTTSVSAVNETDPNAANDSDNEKTSIVREVDLVITKTDDVDPVVAARQLEYTIEVQNLGPSDASGVVVTDTLPAGVTFGSTSGCAEDNAGVPTCTLGAIAAGGSASYTVTVTVDADTASGTIQNDASVTATEPLVNTGDDSTSEETEVIGDFDYGDAPDPLDATAGEYPTLDANGGARHAVAGTLFLGASVDSEADGQPNAAADGDDLAGVDDEDGVTFVTGLAVGGTTSIEVVASGTGRLNAWVDFDGDGEWTLAEQVIIDELLAAGVNPLSFPTPPGGLTSPAVTTLGGSYVRFRFDSGGGLLPTGQADDGEVEDYFVALDTDADLDVAASGRYKTPIAGKLQLYDVTVTNDGPAIAENVVLEQELPAGGIYFGVEPSATPCTLSSGVALSCDLGDLGDGDSANLTVGIVIDSRFEGELETEITASSDAPDPNSANDEVEVTSEVTRARAMLAGEITDPVVTPVWVATLKEAEESVGLITKDGLTGDTIWIGLASPGVRPIALEQVPDFGDSPSPEVAALGFGFDGSTRVTLFDGTSKAVLGEYDLGGGRIPVDIQTLPDFGGPPTPDLAILQRAADGSSMNVLVIDAGDGSVVADHSLVSPGPVPLRVVDLGDILGDPGPELAVLSRDPVTGLTQVRSLEASTGGVFLTVNLVDFFPVDMVAPGNIGGPPDPDVSILGHRESDGKKLVFTLDAVSGLPVGVLEADIDLRPTELEVVPDFDGGPDPELAVLGAKDDGRVLLQVYDAGTQALLGGVSILGSPADPYVPLGLAVHPDFSGDPDPDIGLLHEVLGQPTSLFAGDASGFPFLYLIPLLP